MDIDCESYSLAIESESAFYASISSKSESILNETLTSSATSFAGQTNVSSQATTAFIGATQGATASSIAPETTSWVERPSSTEQPQQGSGISHHRAVKYNAMLSATVFLALSLVFSGP